MNKKKIIAKTLEREMLATNQKITFPLDISILKIKDHDNHFERTLSYECVNVGGRVRADLPTLIEGTYRLHSTQGTTLRLALLPGASSAVKNTLSGKFMA